MTTVRRLAAAVCLMLVACQAAREPPAPVGAPATAGGGPPRVEVAPWAMLAPADAGRGAAGKPAPARRVGARVSGGDAAVVPVLAVATAAATIQRSSPPPPAAPAPGIGVASLPRHVPASTPAGSRYRPRPPEGELSPAIYDRDNPGLALLQRPLEALHGMPAARGGGVDWVLALRQGDISPRAGLQAGAGMEVLDDDVLMRDTAAMPWVLFPHRAHTEWLACSNCHPEPFAARADANEVRMDDILRGAYCGRCHDRVAFPTFACERCHNVLHAGSPRAWWDTGAAPP